MFIDLGGAGERCDPHTPCGPLRHPFQPPAAPIRQVPFARRLTWSDSSLGSSFFAAAGAAPPAAAAGAPPAAGAAEAAGMAAILPLPCSIISLRSLPDSSPISFWMLADSASTPTARIRTLRR
eukprot:360663-Chlamydomonas_euryale.AAC.7